MSSNLQNKPNENDASIILNKFVFSASLLLLSWLLMMVVHEFGHVIGAWYTGGTVQRVVLHPLTISQTDVMPNPDPLLVVWMGPILGVIIPVLFWSVTPRRFAWLRALLQFFAGFCLVANGAYIAIGTFDKVGDCGVMLDNGCSIWQLILFGALSTGAGLYLWHTLGTIRQYFRSTNKIGSFETLTTLSLLVVLLAVEFAFSPR